MSTHQPGRLAQCLRSANTLFLHALNSLSILCSCFLVMGVKKTDIKIRGQEGWGPLLIYFRPSTRQPSSAPPGQVGGGAWRSWGTWQVCWKGGGRKELAGSASRSATHLADPRLIGFKGPYVTAVPDLCTSLTVRACHMPVGSVLLSEGW
jgi:hypothetical protein